MTICLSAPNSELRLAMPTINEKLAVTLWNYKGGVGKSTIALILAEIAAQNGLRVMAVDLDKQQNLAGMFSLAIDPFPSITVRSSMYDDFADENFDFFILDTHPAQNDTVLHALSFADIVLVPILCDYPSLMNLASVFDFVYAADVRKEQAALVKNYMANLQVISEIENIIDNHHFPVAGRLSRCNLLLRNLASGFYWDKSLRENQRKPFLELYAGLWNACRKMNSGIFHHIWS